MPTVPTPSVLLERIRRDVQRNSVRARNGVRHLAGVGRPVVGASEKDVVWQRDKVQLYRYRSENRTLAPPILLVMSLVSKPYVLDLRPGNSFVEALLSRGFDVYMLDWGIPDATESENSFETYCDKYIPRACASAMRESGIDEIHVFGYCLGGVLSLIFAAGHPEIPLRTLSLLAAPIDFAAMGGMTALLRQGRLDPADLIDETGNVPAETMLRGVSATRITGDVVAYASLLENLENSDYIAAHQAMHGWATDHIPFPGACFSQMVQWLIREDRLTKNTLVTTMGPLDLSSISCPVMNAVGTKDHIVPIESNEPLQALVPGLDTLRFESGHVGLIVGGKAHRVTIPAMAEWLEDHSDRR